MVHFIILTEIPVFPLTFWTRNALSLENVIGYYINCGIISIFWSLQMGRFNFFQSRIIYFIHVYSLYQ